MADIILTPIVELIIGTLGSAAVEEIKSVYGARGELTKLESTLSTIRAVLVDAEKRQIRNAQVKDWLEKLETVLFDADDLVYGVGTEGLRRQLMPGKTVRKKVCTFFSSNNQLVFRHKIAREIRDIRERLDAISADKERFHFVRLSEENQPARRVREDSHSLVDQENVVGRDRDRKKIVELLMQPENGVHQEKVSVIPIVGMGGLGKTTLAQLVFNDDRVQQHFDLKTWVCVSDDFGVKILCEKIIKTITNERTENLEMEQLQRKLREKINGKRYLLVLDDVWNEDPGKWEDFKLLLRENCAEGSKIIVTARSNLVADIMGITKPYYLGVLDSEDSWSLFKKMAFHWGKELTNPKAIDIAKKIVEKCKGLPIALRMIGNTLRLSSNPEIDWPSFLQNELSNITQKENGVLSTLKLSYDYLPSHLKPCFSYCALFPKDHEFDVQELVILWMAQGFIKSDQSQSLEDIGYGYFLDLLSRSFFQEAEKDVALNLVIRCKMHDLVHDLAIQVAGKEYKMLASPKENNIHREVHHVSFGFAFESCDRLPSSLLQAKRLRSFLLISGRYGFQRQSICGQVVSNFKFIRMLNLHGMSIRRLPNSVGKLKHLRYLDLSRNYHLRRLPTSITKLVNLQTLKLNDCLDLRELPSKIEKLVNLRHLELNDCDAITHMPRGLSQLTNLQTLSLFVLSDNVPNSLEELIGFNNLKGDELEIRGIRRGIETTVTKLGENEHLRTLDLEFRRRNDDASSNESEWRTTLEGLQPHTNLRKLFLKNYGGSNFDSFLSPLTKLVKLWLSSCSNCQKLPSLDQFHSLKEIYLSDFPALEYITINKGDRFFSTSTSPTISVLPSLQELTLENLPNFRGWWRSDMAEENQVEIFPSFPPLYRLRMACCPKLTSMPCYPNVEKWLTLEETSWKHFERTVLMRVPQARISATTTTKTELEASSSSSSSSVASSYSLSSHPLSNLTYLRLENIVDLQHMRNDCMKGLTSLNELRILKCRELKYLSLFVQYPTSLRYLYIGDCEELEEIKWPETPTNLGYLRLGLDNLPKLNIRKLGQELQGSKDESINLSIYELTLNKLPQLVTLPGGLQFLTNLQSLRISKCDNFTALPDWISKLSSLRELKIRDCPNFKSVPGSISNLTSLQRLEINGKLMNPTDIREDLDVSFSTLGLKLWKIPKKVRGIRLCNN